MDSSPADVVLNIAELADEVLEHCDINVSLRLLFCNKMLYSRKIREMLWRVKVQREFGVVRFKPNQLSFFQQYCTLKGPFTWEDATKGGRCDQLRILRRKSSFSYYQVVEMALKYDQPDVIHYIQEQEKYVEDNFDRKLMVGPKVALYYAFKAFKQSTDSYRYIRILGFLLSGEQLPENFFELMINEGNYKAAVWYMKEVRYLSSRNDRYHNTETSNSEAQCPL